MATVAAAPCTIYTIAVFRTHHGAGLPAQAQTGPGSGPRGSGRLQYAAVRSSAPPCSTMDAPRHAATRPAPDRRHLGCTAAGEDRPARPHPHAGRRAPPPPAPPEQSSAARADGGGREERARGPRSGGGRVRSGRRGGGAGRLREGRFREIKLNSFLKLICTINHIWLKSTDLCTILKF